MLRTKDRPDKDTEVWFETDPSGPLTLTSYKTRTKSRGDTTVLLLSTYPEIPTMGITTDDGHKKSMAFKLYDYTKTGTDIQGKFNDFGLLKCIISTFLT